MAQPTAQAALISDDEAARIALGNVMNTTEPVSRGQPAVMFNAVVDLTQEGKGKANGEASLDAPPNA